MRLEILIGELDGAGNRSRTDDLRITNALLYQLSYPGQSKNVQTAPIFPFVKQFAE